MTSEEPLLDHYSRNGDVLSSVFSAFERAGIEAEDLTPEVLAGVDEFHLGGRVATDAVVSSLADATDDLGPLSRVLDVGSGIGGAARTIAGRIGCVVEGVDLTPTFVAAANELSDRVGLGDRTSFSVGDATRLPFEDDRFDAVTMFHVGMNIEDKEALMIELSRVARPGGRIAIYDIMRTGDGPLEFPMPWSADPSTSFVARAADYSSAMEEAGLALGHVIDRTALTLDALAAVAADPPPVNLSHLMGPDFGSMLANLRSALQAGDVAPTEILATA